MLTTEERVELAEEMHTATGSRLFEDCHPNDLDEAYEQHAKGLIYHALNRIAPNLPADRRAELIEHYLPGVLGC